MSLRRYVQSWIVLGVVLCFASGDAVAQSSEEASGQGTGKAGLATREVSGEATHLKSGQPAYRVKARVTWAARWPTRFAAQYIDPQGRVLMTRQAAHHADRFVPDERIEHPLSGKMSQTTRLARGVRLTYREKTGAPTRSVEVTPPRPYVSGAGLAPYLSSQLSGLADGQTLRFAVLAPSRLDWYRFRAQKSDAHSVRPGQLLVAVDTDSVVLRLFVSTMYFWFDRETGGLMRYQGPVSVEDDAGDMLSVRIDFPNGLGARPR